MQIAVKGSSSKCFWPLCLWQDKKKYFDEFDGSSYPNCYIYIEHRFDRCTFENDLPHFVFGILFLPSTTIIVDNRMFSSYFANISWILNISISIAQEHQPNITFTNSLHFRLFTHKTIPNTFFKPVRCSNHFFSQFRFVFCYCVSLI